MTNQNPIRIDYYSDLLCIWAYIGQARMRKLKQEFGERIDVHWRYLPVFGDVPGKMQASWKDRGLNRGYAAHVQTVAKQFPDVEVHPDVWKDRAPVSSGPAHLWLCAARLVSREAEARLAARIRHAFFCELKDVAQESELHCLADSVDLDSQHLQRAIQCGSAWTELCADWTRGRNEQVMVSPTLIFNDGRQRLSGNVGYRIIKANLDELLSSPDGDHYSWC